jgi:hypothetical protein
MGVRHPSALAVAIRTIFPRPRADMVREQLDVIAGMLGPQVPQARPCSRGAPEIVALRLARVKVLLRGRKQRDYFLGKRVVEDYVARGKALQRDTMLFV